MDDKMSEQLKLSEREWKARCRFLSEFIMEYFDKEDIPYINRCDFLFTGAFSVLLNSNESDKYIERFMEKELKKYEKMKKKMRGNHENHTRN